MNIVFDCFIKNEEDQHYHAYCPCHEVYKEWNKLTSLDNIIDVRDICVPATGKMYSKGGQG